MTDVMQGDQYAVPFYITYIDGDSGEKLSATPEIVENMIITIGNIQKTLPDVTYNATKETWECPLTQDDTFSLSEKSVLVQVRILFTTGDVVGKDVGYLKVTPSVNREVL